MTTGIYQDAPKTPTKHHQHDTITNLTSIKTPQHKTTHNNNNLRNNQHDQLRAAFDHKLATSSNLEWEQRLICYDATDDNEITQPLGAMNLLRKRLDARRAKKSSNVRPADQHHVVTPFNPDGFHFRKIKNPEERIASVALSSGQYHVLTNRFPLFRRHMLLVADELVPQQLNRGHLVAVAELLNQAPGFSAYFNSWRASASVNHFHAHLIDEEPPVTKYPLVPGPVVLGERSLVPQHYPGFCYVFELTRRELLSKLIVEMQADNQPHNLVFSKGLAYVFPKPHERPDRSFDLYPETVGGPELAGSFTVYSQGDYDALTTAKTDEAVRINTTPLPSRLLGPAARESVFDDTLGHGVKPRIHHPQPLGPNNQGKKIRASRSVEVSSIHHWAVQSHILAR